MSRHRAAARCSDWCSRTPAAGKNEQESGPVPDARVLIVDDEPDLVELVGLTLDRMGLAHGAAGTLRDAQKQLLAENCDLVLCDMRLPDGDGLELLNWLQARRPGLPCA